MYNVVGQNVGERGYILNNLDPLLLLSILDSLTIKHKKSIEFYDNFGKTKFPRLNDLIVISRSKCVSWRYNITSTIPYLKILHMVRLQKSFKMILKSRLCKPNKDAVCGNFLIFLE